MKTYRAYREDGRTHCDVAGERGLYRLDPRLDLAGVDRAFAWGREGDPRRFALALLADHFGDPRCESFLPAALALCLAPSLACAVLRNLPVAGFEITSVHLADHLRRVSESLREPITVALAAAFARDRATSADAFEVWRVRYLATLLRGLRCRPAAAREFLRHCTLSENAHNLILHA